MSDASTRLREQAAKARTLLTGLTDRPARAALTTFAAECDDRAAQIEADETSDDPGPPASADPVAGSDP